MNIVFVVDHYNSQTDGTVMTARRLEEALINLGHEVKIVAYGISGKNKYGLKENYMPIVSEISKKFNVVFAKYDKKVLKEAFKGADLVHLFLPFSVERKALRLAHSLNIPVCAAFHVHPENLTKNVKIKYCPKFLRSFIFFWWRKTLFDKVSHIHCPSLLIKEELIKHNYKAKLHVISNGVSADFVPKEKTIKSDKFEILMVGRLAYEKRQDLLIKAVLNSPYKEYINITFAGMGPAKRKYEKLAEKLPNKPKFAFFNKDELIEKIHNSDLYVHAADIEIEGISCIEAFSCGLVPVIGNAKWSATKQFIIDNRCMFEAGNYNSLQEKIDYWYLNSYELKLMSERYVEYAKTFEHKKCVKQMIDFFQEAINDYSK